MIITVIGVIAVTIAALWLYRPPTTTERTEHRVRSEVVPIDLVPLAGVGDGVHASLYVSGRHAATEANSEYHAERLIERFTEQLDTERVLREWMERGFREPTAELIDYGMGGRR